MAERARMRKSEVVAWWIVAGLALIYVLSLVADIVGVNLWAFLIVGCALAVVLWSVFRQRKPVDFTTAVNACWNVQHAYTGEELPKSIEDVYVIPDAQNWIVYFRTSPKGSPVAYRFDPTSSAVIGREVNVPEYILKRIEQSKILTNLAQGTMQRRAERQAAENSGVDPESLDEEAGGAE